jgi:hypothetical protein
MSETVTPKATTQYPSTDPAVITAPLNVPVAFDTLLANSPSVAELQSQITGQGVQITALAARVTALEQAAAAEAPA